MENNEVANLRLKKLLGLTKPIEKVSKSYDSNKQQISKIEDYQLAIEDFASVDEIANYYNINNEGMTEETNYLSFCYTLAKHFAKRDMNVELLFENANDLLHINICAIYPNQEGRVLAYDKTIKCQKDFISQLCSKLAFRAIKGEGRLGNYSHIYKEDKDESSNYQDEDETYIILGNITLCFCFEDKIHLDEKAPQFTKKIS